jgi:DNA repair ATPase RecN
MIVAPGHEETVMDLKLIVAMLAIAAVPVCAQAQQSSTAKLKADAQNVVKIITGDKAKTQTYCQIADLVDQVEKTTEEGKTNELLRKITVLMASMPEYAALVRDFQDSDVDPKSQDAQEIGSSLDALDKLCEH